MRIGRSEIPGIRNMEFRNVDCSSVVQGQSIRCVPLFAANYGSKGKNRNPLIYHCCNERGNGKQC